MSAGLHWSFKISRQIAPLWLLILGCLDPHRDTKEHSDLSFQSLTDQSDKLMSYTYHNQYSTKYLRHWPQGCRKTSWFSRVLVMSEPSNSSILENTGVTKLKVPQWKTTAKISQKNKGRKKKYRYISRISGRVPIHSTLSFILLVLTKHWFKALISH